MATPDYWNRALKEKLKKRQDYCGLAIILCNCKGIDLPELPAETKKAGKKVKDTFKDLKFATVYREEGDPDDLKVLIQQAATLKYHELGLQNPIIVVYLIGHGIQKYVKRKQKQAYCTASGELLIDDDIIVQFQANEHEDTPGVEITKIPKLFFFDCCWGDFPDEGLLVPMGGPNERAQESVKLLAEYTIKPRTGNMLIAHAVTPHFKTYSFPKIQDPNGVLEGQVTPEGPLWSWFLCEELKRNQSIYDVLHRTCHQLVSQYEAWWKDEKVWKMIVGNRALATIQQPVFLSTLNQETIINLAERAGISGSSCAIEPTAVTDNSQQCGQGTSRTPGVGDTPEEQEGTDSGPPSAGTHGYEQTHSGSVTQVQHRDVSGTMYGGGHQEPKSAGAHPYRQSHHGNVTQTQHGPGTMYGGGHQQ